MPKNRPRARAAQRERLLVTVQLDPETLRRLDECLGHFNAGVDQAEKIRVFGFGAVTRSKILRMAIDALHTALLRGDRPAPRKR